MKIYLLATAFLVTMILSGCDGTSGFFFFSSCQNEMARVTATYGTPDEIDQYDADDYHSHTYWYWCSGFAIVFTWGEGVEDSCCQDKNTFNPICE